MQAIVRTASMIIALWCAAWSSSARADSCRTDGDCIVRDAKCREGSCRLTAESMLIPSVASGRLELISPGNLATLTSGKLEVEFMFPPGADEVDVVVMDDWPQYSTNGTLTNRDHVVWYWTSSWDNEASGRLTPAKFRAFRADGDSCRRVEVTALEDGIYHWGVIGAAAGQVTHQSSVWTFSVGAENLTGKHCVTSDDCQAAAHSRCHNTQNYCVLECASDLDCFEKTRCDTSAIDINGYGVCRPPGKRCECRSGEFCDNDQSESLELCYRPSEAGLGASGCCADQPGEKKAPSLCFVAACIVPFLRLARRRRRQERQ